MQVVPLRLRKHEDNNIIAELRRENPQQLRLRTCAGAACCVFVKRTRFGTDLQYFTNCLQGTVLKRTSIATETLVYTRFYSYSWYIPVYVLVQTGLIHTHTSYDTSNTLWMIVHSVQSTLTDAATCRCLFCCSCCCLKAHPRR